MSGDVYFCPQNILGKGTKCNKGHLSNPFAVGETQTTCRAWDAHNMKCRIYEAK